MCPAAELARDAVDLDDPDLVAVLLAEEHHRAELLRVGFRDDVSADRVVLEHDLIHAPLDRVPLLDRHRLWVGEVETQLVGPHL